MHRIVRSLAVLSVLAAALPVLADDQEKANKEIIRARAMAVDATGRAVVSRALSDVTGVKRADLLLHRQSMNLDYGSLFVAEELIKSGVKPEDLTVQLRSGKTIALVANDQHVNWKQLAADAKKLNSKIDDCLYKHFLNVKADKERDLEEKYDVSRDAVPADSTVGVPKPEIEAAAERFNMWKDRALAAGGSHHVMDTAEEQAAYSDHDRAGGPVGNGAAGAAAGSNGSVGTPAPAAGGARTGPN
jgi:hypothetical protein